jgi:hypothetical protein
MFHKMFSCYWEESLVPHPNPKLSTTAYSIHLQLHYIPGGCSSIHNLRIRHAVVTESLITHQFERHNTRHLQW